MKKILSSGSLKNVSYILGYWFIFVITPAIVARFLWLKDNNSSVSGWLTLYIVFIAPFLYFIPYNNTKSNRRFLFLLFGLLIPYLFIYLFIYFEFRKSFHPGF